MVPKYIQDLVEYKTNSFEEKINSMFDNVDNGFLNTRTIYRVKKNEK